MIRWWRGKKKPAPEDGMVEEQQFMINARILLKELMTLTHGRCPRGVPIRCFPKRELEDATNYYGRGRVFHSEGFYTLYEGYLRERRVIVKKYEERIPKAACIREIVFTSQMSVHGHVLKFLGCCLEADLPALVFEYVDNGNLRDYIRYPSEGEAKGRALSWKERVKIAADVASAVTYLHTAFPRPVVHRDLNPSNIFLDEDCNAKLTDFSLSVLVPENERYITAEQPAGTLGYMSPECFMDCGFNEKADVYGFGVIVLALLTGERWKDMGNLDIGGANLDFEESPLQGYLKQRIGLIDPEIFGETSCPEKKQQWITFAKLAYQCTRRGGDERPTMAQVEEQLRQMYAET